MIKTETILKDHTYNVETLANGLRLLHVPFPEAASVYLKIMGKAGNRAEGPDELGLAHFFEHLVFDGTPTMKTGSAVSRTIERLGARYNGVTGDETVRYWTRALPSRADAAATWLGDIFSHSLYRESDVEKERKVIEEELLARFDNPENLFHDEFCARLYPDHPMGYRLREIRDFLPRVNRENLLAFRSRCYGGGNFLLLVAGNITFDTARKLANAHFSKIESGPEIAYVPPPKVTPFTYIDNRDVEQAKLRIVFPGFPQYSRESDVASSVASALGDGASSRLFTRLREELHLVYGIGAGHNDYSDGGEFIIGTKLKTEKIPSAVIAIREVLDGFLSEGPTDEEFERTINQAETALALGAEDVEHHGNLASYQLLFKKQIRSPREIMQELQSISKDEVLAMAKRIFSATPHVGVMAKGVTSLDFPAIGDRL
ncbi:MAG: hypothetical protein COV10_02200 [Candidatus Vogelbacteria bacterium CG10_big_fil_rev_8_21_14_0_10_51_16]|uniref:Insulinase family protein n=1 Tax=Candidatus Vogelbacteria bacterium CG10_big_fil_rev_8_21_14_0_10_51_16 TaxID=1975045 RepID=A0A2H0RED2_9BACT|nr:MAG: hypothetical protein COV10_02200 [Candidatus Vogelbacteria bacterium CG10_big_fil_rev_8_21_14_0_10_51_16]